MFDSVIYGFNYLIVCRLIEVYNGFDYLVFVTSVLNNVSHGFQNGSEDLEHGCCLCMPSQRI